MKLNLKLNLFVMSLLTTLIVSNAFATIVWTGPSGYWSDAALWDKGTLPDAADAIKFTKPGTICTLDSDLSGYSIGKISIASGPDNANAAALVMAAGGYLATSTEFNIGAAGATGNGSIGYFTQTGGDIFVNSAGKVQVGYKSPGVGYYTMSGGSLTGDGTLYIGGAGATGASGTFTVVGTDPVINIRKIYVGVKDSTGAYPGTATFNFQVGADGVSPIRTQIMYVDPFNDSASVANLLVNLTAAPPVGDILLVEKIGSGPIHGVFDSINGIAAVEGASVALSYGGINYLYNLTYLYDAAGDGNFNDIALSALALTIPEPATVALLALGGLLSLIKRR
jgi:hypothetical protein